MSENKVIVELILFRVFQYINTIKQDDDDAEENGHF